MANDFIVIAGCGRLGSILANHFSQSGSSVVVIDQNEQAFRRLSAEFSGFRIHKNAVDVAALREANIENADCLLATTNEDNVNLMVAQTAKVVFNVPLVLARVYAPEHEAVYRELGVRVISPTQLSVQAFLNAME